MKCLYCGDLESKVIDSRPVDDNTKIRRRRECLKCGKRFTTYEVVETITLMVIKKDKAREAFDHEKLLRGLMNASYKRPVSFKMLDNIVDNIEQALMSENEHEVSSLKIGELAMMELEKIDQVAYVRFASVYRQFSDIDTFMSELKNLKGKQKDG